MIFALVTFKPYPKPEDAPPVDRLALIEGTAPKYQSIPGLRRKYYIGQEGLAGGAYEWETKAHAEAYYTDKWRAFMEEQYGSDLQITYFDCPAVVDNVGERVDIDPSLKEAAE